MSASVETSRVSRQRLSRFDLGCRTNWISVWVLQKSITPIPRPKEFIQAIRPFLTDLSSRRSNLLNVVIFGFDGNCGVPARQAIALRRPDIGWRVSTLKHQIPATDCRFRHQPQRCFENRSAALICGRQDDRIHDFMEKLATTRF